MQVVLPRMLVLCLCTVPNFVGTGLSVGTELVACSGDVVSWICFIVGTGATFALGGGGAPVIGVVSICLVGVVSICLVGVVSNCLITTGIGILVVGISPVVVRIASLVRSGFPLATALFACARGKLVGMRLAIPVGRIDTGSLLISVGAFYIASHLVFVRGIFKYTTLFTWVAFDIVDCKGLLSCVRCSR